MTGSRRRYTDDVPPELAEHVREICSALPETYEEDAWVGTRWRVRTKTFAQVLGVRGVDADGSVVLAFRSSGEDLEVLRNVGGRFMVLGWGRDALGLVLDDETDWTEVRELVTDSYCVMAPKQLAALVDRPDDPADRGAQPEDT
jgi:hypothetical protein